jgi:hypothetical protein
LTRAEGHAYQGHSPGSPWQAVKTAGTRPIVAKRLDGPKRRIRTREVGIRIIRVAHEAADLKVLTVNQASRRVMEKAGLKLVQTFCQPWPYPADGDQIEVVREVVRYVLDKAGHRHHHQPAPREWSGRKLALMLGVKPRNMLTQLGEPAPLGFFTRTGLSTYKLNPPSASTLSTNPPDP